jgi:hypothetical protein
MHSELVCLLNLCAHVTSLHMFWGLRFKPYLLGHGLHI